MRWRSHMSIMRTTDGWRGEHQMTEPITDEKFYNEHAALLGHVARGTIAIEVR
jgi:hypothetical protein